MKILKFLLVLFLLSLVALLGGVIFSDKIVFYMTKTKNSEFKNLEFLIRDGEILFDDFIVNGKRLGKGKAKINFIGTGPFKLNPEIKISSLKLEKVDLKEIYTASDVKIDSFVKKVYTPVDDRPVLKSTEQFIKESSEKLEKLNTDADDFLNNGIKVNLETINKIKTDYAASPDLKVKSQKVSELGKEVTILTGKINAEKEKIEKAVSLVEEERALMFSNISDELTKLEKVITLNDVQNINSYILTEKGKEISEFLNKSLKTVNLIDEIRKLSLTITDIDINNGEIKFENLNEDSKLKGETVISGSEKATVKLNGKNYEIIFNTGNISIDVLYGERILATVEYKKDNILEGTVLNLVSEFIFENDSLKDVNKTALTEAQKTALTEKINNMQTVSYSEITQKYSEQVKSLETLISSVYEKREKLNSLQRELSLLTVVSSGTGENPVTPSEPAQENSNTPPAGR